MWSYCRVFISSSYTVTPSLTYTHTLTHPHTLTPPQGYKQKLVVLCNSAPLRCKVVELGEGEERDKGPDLVRLTSKWVVQNKPSSTPGRYGFQVRHLGGGGAEEGLLIPQGSCVCGSPVYRIVHAVLVLITNRSYYRCVEFRHNTSHAWSLHSCV